MPEVFLDTDTFNQANADVWSRDATNTANLHKATVWASSATDVAQQAADAEQQRQTDEAARQQAEQDRQNQAAADQWAQNAAAQYAMVNPPAASDQPAPAPTPASPPDASQPAQPSDQPSPAPDQTAATVAPPVAVPMDQSVPMGPADTAAPVPSTPAPAPAPASVAPTVPTTAPAAAPSGSYADQARAAAQKYGLDPNLFVAQMQQESGLQPFNPDGTVKVSPAGARGVAQIMPDTAKAWGVNPDDPSAALDAAAHAMAGYVQQYGDPQIALAAYNAGPGNVAKYGGIPPFAETQAYVKNIMGNIGAAVGGAVAGAGQAVQGAASGAQRVVQAAVNHVTDMIPDQFHAGLDDATAYAACGPVAAIAFAQKMGRNPTAQEAVELAKRVGWTPAQGMAGPSSELDLLKSMNIPAHMEQGFDINKVAADVANGNPVIISTPGHYFVADAYDADSRTFHVGKTGTALKAGAEWMSLDQMQKVMGPAQATLFLDAKPGDGPSVAADQTAASNGPAQPLPDIPPPSSPPSGPFDPLRHIGDTISNAITTGLQNIFGGVGDSQLVRNITGTNPNQAALDTGFQQNQQTVRDLTGATAQLPSSPGDLLNAGLGEPTGGQYATDQRNEAIAGANPLRDVPVVGGATTFAAQTALDPTNLLLMGEPGVARAVGSVAREGAVAAGDVLGSDVVQSAVRSRLPAEAEAGFAMGMPKPPDTPLPPPPTGDVPERAANILLDKFPEDVRPHIQQAADTFGQFMDQRRGVISDPQALQNAADVALGTPVEKWLKTPAGTAFNQESAIALGQTLAKAGQDYNLQLAVVQAARQGGTLTPEMEAQLARATLQFNALAAVRAGSAAEAGRSLRAFNVALTGEAGSRTEAIARAFKAIGTDPERFQQWVEQFSAIPADDTVARYKMLQGLQEPSMWQKISAWRYASMLSSWYTHLNNASSNLAQAFARPVQTAAGGYLGEAGADVRGILQAVPDAAAVAMNTLRTGVSQRGAVNFENIRPRPLGDSPIARAITLPTDLLSAADDFFQLINHAGALRAAATREAGGDAAKFADLLANPTKAMLDEATTAGERAVFQEDPGKFMNQLMKLRSTPGPGGLAVQFFLPFLRTPTNIFVRGARLTAQPVTGLVKTGAAIAQGDTRTARLEAGQTALAWLLGGALAAKAANGEMSGNGPTDPAKRRLLTSQGWQANSIKVGDQWINYQNFGPVSVPMSVLANGWEAAQEAGRVDHNTASAAVQGILKGLADTSFISQIGEAVKLASGDQNAATYLQNLVASTAGSFIPYGSGLAAAAQVGDTTQRAPLPGADASTGILQRTEARIPGLRQNEPPSLDVLGRPQPSPPATNPLALVVRASQSRPDEMLTLLDRAGMSVPDPPSSTSLRPGVTFEIKPEERPQFRQFEGEYMQQVLTELASDQDFKSAPIEVQQQILKRQLDKAHTYATLSLADVIPDAELEQRVQKTLDQQQTRRQPLPVP